MKKRQGDWRKKVFCLLLGLMMVFSQMGFAFAETGLDLSGEPQPSQTEEPQAGGETQDTEQPQTPEQPQEAETPAEEPQQPTPARTADELLNAANQLAEANLPQILANARMRMVYEGKQAMKMADAFGFTANAEAEGGGTWAWASYTPEGSEEAVSCGTLNYYTIEDTADWEALTACVNAGNTLAGKTVVLANNVDFEHKVLTPVGNVRKKLQGRTTVYINVPFSGIFDGQDHALQNILFDNEKATYDEIDVALFGCIENAEIKDLTVSGAVKVSSGSYKYIAAVVGRLDGKSTIKHVINRCDVNVTNSGATYAAGIVYKVAQTGTMHMENCANYGYIYSDALCGNVAGLLNDVEYGNSGDNKIINCFNAGKVEGIDKNNYMLDGRTHEIAGADVSDFSEVRGCYGVGTGYYLNDLFMSYSQGGYEKRCLVSCNSATADVKNGNVTYVPQEQLNSWKTVWLLNQGSTTPAYTLKDGKLQWAEADSPTVYQFVLSPYSYNQEASPITADLEVTEPEKNLLGQVEQGYYVLDGTELKITLGGTVEQYPVYTLTELENCDPSVGQSRFEANDEKKAALEMTLKIEGKNITLQYGSLAEYEQVPNTVWYADQKSEFTLQTTGELRGFAQLVNEGNDFSGRTVKLGSDIDVSSGDWTPIASTSETPFKGVFDGADHTITYQISLCEEKDMALFGYLDSAELKNLTVAGQNSAKKTSTINKGTAGLCASATNSKIADCTNRVKIPQGGQNTAGIVGTSTNCVIENCVNKADITGGKNVAGIVANAGNKNTATAYTLIRNCTNKGTITGGGGTGTTAVGAGGGLLQPMQPAQR